MYKHKTTGEEITKEQFNALGESGNDSEQVNYIWVDKRTLGEKRVRTEFNPSNNSIAQNVKERAAELINYINENVNAGDNVPNNELGEFLRLKALAMTHVEDAAMWAVKAATY